jgi:hypothetical protein
MAADKRVLMVGTFHFTSKRDFVTHDVDDVRSPRRQAELAALTERLASYQPTKVLIEYPYAKSESINADYATYRGGARDLSGNEAEQIGWRLAAELGHERIYPVDIMHKWFEEGLETNPRLAPLWSAHISAERDSSSDFVEKLARWTVGELLADGNTPERQRRIEDYLTVYVRLVDGDDYSGADVAGNWYHRNLRIYANILRVAEPGDRLFILYGASHIPLFWHLVTESGEFDIDDPLPYLT